MKFFLPFLALSYLASAQSNELPQIQLNLDVKSDIRKSAERESLSAPSSDSARPEPTSGGFVTAKVDGSGLAKEIAISRNGEPEQRLFEVPLPFEFTVPLAALPDEEWTLAVLTEAGISSTTLRTASTASNRNRVTIRFFVPYNGGLAEVITGSRGGGLFIRRSRFCAVPNTALSRCPAQFVVSATTDRASRGETIFTRFDNGQGLAQASIEINGATRVGPIPVPLPLNTIWPNRVSVNANDDDITIKVLLNGVLSERRVPVGRRP